MIKVITAEIVNLLSTKKHQIDKKVLRQDRDSSTRLNYANKEIREICMNKLNTKYSSTEDMIDKLQQLKGKTKLKIYKNISNYYNELKKENFQTQQVLLAKNAQGKSKIYYFIMK